ncbi:MAG TPA: heavy-metal-associated domain-containing protein [Gammaproteobacteria bacterium]|nr:heavy-metal-associated domain-containing protein [Gammaproteobacteria bacterium]
MLLLTLTVVVWSTNGWAGTIHYEAQVKGMVCAFCAYSVSKKIGSLPGVDAESVDVDLEGGRVRFTANQPVSPPSLAAVFQESGFSLDKLTEVGPPSSGKAAPDKLPLVLDLRLDSLDTARFEGVFEALGNIAAAGPSRLLIEAPGALEGELLKPVLMGRKQVMKVRFSPSDTASIHLRLYLRQTGPEAGRGLTP